MRDAAAGARKGTSRLSRAFRAALALLLLTPAAAAEGAKAQAAAPAAILIKGTLAVRGLPFFGPNAIGALYGEYLLGEGARDAASALEAAGALSAMYEDRLVPVWYTKERVVLSPAWKGSTAAGSGSRILARAEGPVLCLAGEGYFIFLELDAETSEAMSFVRALGRKFAVFFRNASSDAELSFPSTVEY